MLPLVVVPFALGALAMYVWKRVHSARIGPLQIEAAGQAPSAITVLGFCLQRGQTPPPVVIETALAEAQATGQHELARQIIEGLIAPVVRARAAELARGTPQQADAAPPAAASADPSDMSAADVDRLCMDAPPSKTAPIATVAGRVIERPAPRSPLVDVDADQWQKLVGRLERERPDFASGRHVGRFRQRVERLADLGVEPQKLVGDAIAQEAALGIELSDADRHAAQGGLYDELVNTALQIDDKEHQVTRSGVLGVIQAAGLEGAVEWFLHPADRRRFPHTTKQFLATNGVF